MYRRRVASGEVNKPFKPLVVSRRLNSQNGSSDAPCAEKRDLDSSETVQHEAKRAKPQLGSSTSRPVTPTHVAPSTLAPSQAYRRPVLNSNPVAPKASSASTSTATSTAIPDQYFEVLWRKTTQKKNKTWDGDGIIVIENNINAVLQNTDGKPITKSRLKPGTAIEEGELLKMGYFEVELGTPIPREKFLSGSLFLDSGSDAPAALVSAVAAKAYVAPKLLNGLAASTSGAIRRNNKVQGPRHDPLAEGAVVMPRPANSNKHIIDVVVDPLLSQHLRPHQKEGVQFLYECVMGMRDYQGKGALLADEMGLGKTLMTITLIWTLLKQSPYMNETPVVKRALIVCPVTLIANWKKEFRKWLGSDRIGVFTLDNKNHLRDFVAGRCYQVMIVGYEKLRSISSELKKASIDMIICDEGHRLKTATNKSAQAMLTLQIDKRVILSGTPIQNDLGEFYTMVDFLNPGILGSSSTFKREFELPIMKSRQPEAMKKDIEKGRKRSEELSRLTKLFTLRRTADTLDKYLPPKTDTVLFCSPTSQQIQIYSALLESNLIKRCMGSADTADTLRAITILKKLCNSPTLIKDSDFGNSNVEIPPMLSTSSGKLKVLEAFLHKLYTESSEKVVIVSGYTSTLDLIEDKLGEMNLASLRLDGSTQTKKRQSMVDQFNSTSPKQCFAFLLSAKSGGTGLNLVGASRLFLFDTDWNPSVDLQAMARVHRDGQKRPVYIYRLLTTGTMDEKIYQRQITKQGLADTFMDGGAAATATTGKQRLLSVARDMKPKGASGSNTFSLTELQDLFSLNASTKSNTHDLLDCKCHDPLASSPQSMICSSIASRENSLAEEVPTQKTAFPKPGSIYELDSDDDDNDSQDSEGLGGWITARSVAEGTAPVPRRLQNKDKMKGLFEFNHIDPSSATASDEPASTGDSILDSLLEQKDGCRSISFIFTKSTLEPTAEPKEGSVEL